MDNSVLIFKRVIFFINLISGIEQDSSSIWYGIVILKCDNWYDNKNAPLEEAEQK